MPMITRKWTIKFEETRRASVFRVQGTDRTCGMERSKGGRPPRWADDVELKWVKARMPAPLAEAFQHEAQKQGMTVQDFLGHLAESLTGVPYDPQGGLQISA